VTVTVSRGRAQRPPPAVEAYRDPVPPSVEAYKDPAPPVVEAYKDPVVVPPPPPPATPPVVEAYKENVRAAVRPPSDRSHECPECIKAMVDRLDKVEDELKRREDDIAVLKQAGDKAEAAHQDIAARLQAAEEQQRRREEEEADDLRAREDEMKARQDEMKETEEKEEAARVSEEDAAAESQRAIQDKLDRLTAAFDAGNGAEKAPTEEQAYPPTLQPEPLREASPPPPPQIPPPPPPPTIPPLPPPPPHLPSQQPDDWESGDWDKPEADSAGWRIPTQAPPKNAFIPDDTGDAVMLPPPPRLPSQQPDDWDSGDWDRPQADSAGWRIPTQAPPKNAFIPDDGGGYE